MGEFHFQRGSELNSLSIKKKLKNKKIVKMLWGSVKEGGLPNHPLRKIIREDSMGSLDVSSCSSESNDSSFHHVSAHRQYSQSSDIFQYLDEETQDAIYYQEEESMFESVSL